MGRLKTLNEVSCIHVISQRELATHIRKRQSIFFVARHKKDELEYVARREKLEGETGCPATKGKLEGGNCSMSRQRKNWKGKTGICRDKGKIERGK